MRLRLLSLAMLVALGGCVSPARLPGMVAGAPEAFLDSRPLVEGSACMLVALIVRCNSGDAILTTGLEDMESPVAPLPVMMADGEASTVVRVMNWNVEGLPPPLRFGRSDAIEDIGEELAAMRARGEAPHILLIQEGFMPAAMRGLIAKSGYRYVARGPRTGHEARDEDAAMGDPWLLRGEGIGKLLGGGLYILSDFPILEAWAEPFASCAGVDCLSNKGAMLARIQIPGAPAPVTVINTHMNSQNSTQTPKARAHLAHRGQVDALERFVRDHAPAGEAMIFGGDFNMGGSPERWTHAVPVEPFAFTHSYCRRSDAACDLSALTVRHSDPRTMQDLQGFHNGVILRMAPQRMAVLHDPQSPGALSDHGALVADYRLSWDAEGAAPADTPSPSFARLFVSAEDTARALVP